MTRCCRPIDSYSSTEAVSRTPRALPDRKALAAIVQSVESHYSHACKLGTCGSCNQMLDRIMAWVASGRRLTRAGLERVWKQAEGAGTATGCFKADAMLDAICRYIEHGEDVPVEWCEHCPHDGGMVGGIPYATFPSDWRFCPVCAAPRPEEG